MAILAIAWLWLRGQRVGEQFRRAMRERAEATEARIELQRQIQRERGQLAALGAADFDALLLVDADRRIVWGNQGAWELFDRREPVVGQPFIALVGDAELSQTVLEVIAGGRPVVRQVAVGGRTLRMRVVAIQETGGAAVSIEDVTELQRLGRARRDLVANISHELRTPLANIALAAQTLRNGGADTAIHRRMLDQIEGQVQALSQLSQEMMDLAQIESGQVMLKLVPVEVEPLVRRSLTALLPLAAAKGQHVSVIVPAGLVALADEQQVARVIGNLAHNAIKFSPEGGIISVYAEAAGDDVRIGVTDTGPGIPLAEQARVFERFYKADRARSKGGTGLGLAIARHIVEGHGGRIWVESAPGQGAKFCFTLPRA
ncbi:MAG: ATP-binding protein [Chloroflexi bacterium]|nr:ATP-binding protein [Chloroflexota bacterium]